MISNAAPTPKEAEGLSTASALEENKGQFPYHPIPSEEARAVTSAPSHSGTSLRVGEPTCLSILFSVLSKRPLHVTSPLLAS